MISDASGGGSGAEGGGGAEGSSGNFISNFLRSTKQRNGHTGNDRYVHRLELVCSSVNRQTYVTVYSSVNRQKYQPIFVGFKYLRRFWYQGRFISYTS
jgi:hypothetical protein